MTVPLPGKFKRMSLAPSGVRINTLVSPRPKATPQAGPKTGPHGSPVLLLHGYPQTHVMWHHVAPILAEHHSVVLTDLRGYGDSGKPAGGHNHEAYAKRTMAADQVQVMRELGFDEFAVVGHDRGARVAHRMALDYPQAVTKIAVLDIVPTRHALQNASREFGLGYWHWFFLAQPEPLPEQMLGNDPDGWIRGRLSALRDADGGLQVPGGAGWRPGRGRARIAGGRRTGRSFGGRRRRRGSGRRRRHPSGRR